MDKRTIKSKTRNQDRIHGKGGCQDQAIERETAEEADIHRHSKCGGVNVVTYFSILIYFFSFLIFFFRLFQSLQSYIGAPPFFSFLFVYWHLFIQLSGVG